MVLTIRDVRSEDAAELADLLNAIIEQGGTTALETAFSASYLDETYLTGPAVHCCFVAVNDNELLGFQTLVGERHLPEGCADIATFTQIDGTQKGVGSKLFSEAGLDGCTDRISTMVRPTPPRARAAW